LVHEGGFGCEKGKDGQIVFRNQQGKPIPKSGHQPPSYVENFVHRLKEKMEDRHIHSQICVTKWQGEKMDRHLAVGHLWHLTQSSN